MSKIVRYRFMGSWWRFWLLCVSGIGLHPAIAKIIASADAQVSIPSTGLPSQRHAPATEALKAAIKKHTPAPA